MNELYVFRLWDMMERHLRRQTKRGLTYDRHFTFLSVRELHFAIHFHARQLTHVG